MKEALEKEDQFDSFVIDDAEDCILNHGIDLVDQDGIPKLRCFTQLLKKKTFLITSSTDSTFLKAMHDLNYIEKNPRNFDEVMEISGYIRPNMAEFKFQTFANKLEVTDCIAKDIVVVGGGVIVICESMRSILKLTRHERI